VNLYILLMQTYDKYLSFLNIYQEYFKNFWTAVKITAFCSEARTRFKTKEGKDKVGSVIICFIKSRKT
jgi:hypothetical protein